MRISDNILPLALFIAGLGLASAFAFDGTRTPGDVAPLVGGPAAPGAIHTPGAGGTAEAFQSGTKALRAGDTKTGITALEYAAANGHTIAQWKLGRMYADGDGVNRDDLRAFEYFRSIVEALEYAARGETGLNFYDARGKLLHRLAYADPQVQAERFGRRLVGAGIGRGERLVIVADTWPGFCVAFFGAQYAGVLPVPVATPAGIGAKDSYIAQLRRQPGVWTAEKSHRRPGGPSDHDGPQTSVSEDQRQCGRFRDHGGLRTC